MIIDSSLLNLANPELRKAVEDFHYYLGSYYDLTIIPADNPKILGTSFSDLISSGDGVLVVVNRQGYRYRENRDILKVLEGLLEINPDLSVIKKSSINYDLFLFTFETGVEAELNKPKKNLIRKRKKESETPVPVVEPEPIKVNFDADPYEGEKPEE